MKTNTEVKQSDKLELAYISHKGKMEAIGNVYDRLVKWATPQDLINKETRMLTIYHDSPKITDSNYLRMSACIVLSHALKVDGEVVHHLRLREVGHARFRLQVHGLIDDLLHDGHIRVVTIVGHGDHRGRRQTPPKAPGAHLGVKLIKEFFRDFTRWENFWVLSQCLSQLLPFNFELVFIVVCIDH